jgi:membrane associated rhomboid family serine protease
MAARLHSAFLPLTIAISIIILELINTLLGHRLSSFFGITPETILGVPKIFTAPFFHGSLRHAMGNMVPFVVLGSFIIMSHGKQRFLTTCLSIMVFSGLATWLIGKTNTVHFGASGVVFGLIAYLMFLGFYSRRILYLFTSATIILFYGTVFVFGLLPIQDGISWEGHLSGAICGIALARYYGQNMRAI